MSETRFAAILGLGLLVCLPAGCQVQEGGPKPEAGGSGSTGVNPSGGASAPVAVDSEALQKPVAGQLLGKPFLPDQIVVAKEGPSGEKLKLTFRTGTGFFADQQVELELTPPQQPAAGQVWEFGGDSSNRAFVSLSSKSGAERVPDTEMVFQSDYRLRLTIDTLSESNLTGTVDLRVSRPQGNFLTGTFRAEIEALAKDPPRSDDKPYITGKIAVTGEVNNSTCRASIFGQTREKQAVGNGAGLKLTATGAWEICTTFKPQLSSLAQEAEGTIVYKHTKLPPGEYVVSVFWEGVVAVSKLVTVEADSGATIDFAFDPAEFGELTIELPEGAETPQDRGPFAQAHRRGPSVIPADLKPPFRIQNHRFQVPVDEEAETSVTLPEVAPGKYLIRWGEFEGEVEVQAREKVSVTLAKP